MTRILVVVNSSANYKNTCDSAVRLCELAYLVGLYIFPSATLATSNAKCPIYICTNKMLWHNDTYSHICMNHDLSYSKGIRYYSLLFMKNRSLSRLVKVGYISSTFYGPRTSFRYSVCVCTQTLGCFRDRLLFIRVMEFFLRVVWTLRSFRPLNVSQGNDAEVFFAVCSIFKSWKLFFMFKNCCVTQLTWKIRGKSSR